MALRHEVALVHFAFPQGSVAKIPVDAATSSADALLAACSEAAVRAPCRLCLQQPGTWCGLASCLRAASLVRGEELVPVEDWSLPLLPLLPPLRGVAEVTAVFTPLRGGFAWVAERSSRGGTEEVSFATLKSPLQSLGHLRELTQLAAARQDARRAHVFCRDEEERTLRMRSVDWARDPLGEAADAEMNEAMGLAMHVETPTRSLMLDFPPRGAVLLVFVWQTTLEWPPPVRPRLVGRTLHVSCAISILGLRHALVAATNGAPKAPEKVGLWWRCRHGPRLAPGTRHFWKLPIALEPPPCWNTVVDVRTLQQSAESPCEARVVQCHDDDPRWLQYLAGLDPEEQDRVLRHLGLRRGGKRRRVGV